MIEVIPEKMVDRCTEYAKNGIFVVRSMCFWNSRLSYTMLGEQRVKFTPSKVLNKYDLKRVILKDRINRLFTFLAHKTVYGFYFHERDVKKYSEEIAEINNDVQEYRNFILLNFSDVSKEIKRGCVELAQFKWKNELRNPGFPPEIFVEQFGNEYLEYSKRRLEKNMRFIMYPICPFIDPSMKAYGNEKEIEEINKKVAINLYDSIIKKRAYLVKYLLRKTKEKKNRYKSICTFLQLWKKGVFYEDQGLIEHINAVRDSIMRNVKREERVVFEAINRLITYISEHEDYLVGFTLKKGN